jgi:hypothetical protein
LLLAAWAGLWLIRAASQGGPTARTEPKGSQTMNEISFAATGNLVADPELRFTPAGRPVATIRFAVNSRKRTAGGDWVDQPASYFTGSVWGPMAENLESRSRRVTGCWSRASW